jgi:hypothetical protein
VFCAPCPWRQSIYDDRIRPRISLSLALAISLLAAGTAASATQRVTLTPPAGKAGTRIVVRGIDWAQIEFCKPRVILAVDDVVFARAVLDGRGRFALRWRIPHFVPGKHRVFATQHCESGMDGSPILVTRHVDLRVIA